MPGICEQKCSLRAHDLMEETHNKQASQQTHICGWRDTFPYSYRLFFWNQEHSELPSQPLEMKYKGKEKPY